MPVSNFDRVISHSEMFYSYLRTVQVNILIVPRPGHNRSLSNPNQFISQPFICHYIALVNNRIVK